MWAKTLLVCLWARDPLLKFGAYSFTIQWDRECDRQGDNNCSAGLRAKNGGYFEFIILKVLNWLSQHCTAWEQLLDFFII